MEKVTVQVGDFCCVPISGNVGKLISIGEWLDGSGFTDYDHAEIFVGMANVHEAPYGYTFGAYPGGASLVPLPCPPEALPGALWSTGHFGLDAAISYEIVQECLKLKGVPYSALDYFALVAHRLHMPGKALKNYIASTDHMICSQLVDYVYMLCGIHLFTDGRWPGYVTPADLAKLILGK